MLLIKTAQFEEIEQRPKPDVEHRILEMVINQVENTLYTINSTGPLAQAAMEKAKAKIRQALEALRTQ